MQTEQGMNNVYIHTGTNPFDTITQAVKYVLLPPLGLNQDHITVEKPQTKRKTESDTINYYLKCRAVEKHMQTFHHREKKKVCRIYVHLLWCCGYSSFVRWKN